MATEQLLVSIILILVAARVLGEVFQRIGQPPLVGELFAGLIIGPSILGLVLRGDDLHVLSSLGIFFLMFLAGLEMDPREIRHAGGSTLVISTIAFFIPLLAGTGTSFFWAHHRSVLVHGLTVVNNCCSSECHSANEYEQVGAESSIFKTCPIIRYHYSYHHS